MKNLKPIGVPHSIFLENIFAKTYDATKLEEDTERVRAEYQNRGYFKAGVSDPKTEIHDTGHKGFHIPLMQAGPGKAVDITMPIEEGDQYRLGKITFKNNKAISNTAALRSLFPLKDGDIFSRDKIAKGLEALRKAYGEYGYINYTGVPSTTFDDDKKLAYLEIDVDEGKQFYVRRIEFVGNTTTRDKVIRRELALEEGGVYNSRLWELSLLRLNQLSYFDQLKPDDPNVTDKKLDEKNGQVDLTLKVHEKGKNSIGLNGGVSGLEGAFIGLNYATNNFLGRGETLQVQISLGNLARSVMFGFTQPYMFDRPLQFGFTVFGNKISYNQARQLSIFSGQQLESAGRPVAKPAELLAVERGLHDFAELSVAPVVQAPGHHVFAGPVQFDRAEHGVQEPFRFHRVPGNLGTERGERNHHQQDLPQLFIQYAGQRNLSAQGASADAGDGIGGHRRHGPVGPANRSVQAVHSRCRTAETRSAITLNGSFISGYGGLVAPPFQRFFMGGENDIRGFDIRSISPVAFLPSSNVITLTNPDGTPVPKNPANPRQGNWTIPIPVDQIVFPGGDLSVWTNLEYRITIAGPVAIAPFVDAGIDPIVRPSQLQIATAAISTR